MLTVGRIADQIPWRSVLHKVYHEIVQIGIGVTDSTTKHVHAACICTKTYRESQKNPSEEVQQPHE